MHLPSFVVLLCGQVASYLIGGIPFGYLITRWRTGLDIRREGSGNIGATNVGRVLGVGYFVLVFALDFLKGALPVLGSIALREHATVEGADYLPEAVGFAAILGHVFPIYLGMKGGKGVATTIGVLISLAPLPTLAGLIAWVVLVLITRMVSVGSIGFAATLAVVYFSQAGGGAMKPWEARNAANTGPFWQPNLALSIVVVLIVLLVVLRHLGNIRRILSGTEPRVRLPWSSRDNKSTIDRK